MLRYTTAGESHGKCVLATVEGLPYGTPVSVEAINAELARRQGGYGRGARMKLERDQAEILTGVRKGLALGGPVTLKIANRVQNSEELGVISRPRPGHADLAGAMKYDTRDARGIAERASARETAGRVAAGALAGAFLNHFGIRVLGYVTGVDGISGGAGTDNPDELVKARDASAFYVLDAGLDKKIKVKVDEARSAGDTLGGVFEVRCFNVPPGLGSHVSWEEKLDGAIARALMSIQSVKGVEIGLGFGAALEPGSRVHDEIVLDRAGKLARSRNNAGGIEGGMTNGRPVVARAVCKPISTLRKPLRTVDLATKEPIEAQYERSDVCVLPAASVVGQAVTAFEIARAFIDKFGGDTFEETRRRCEAFREGLTQFGA